MLPLARKSGLVVEKLEDETLVYDLRSDEAHCLNGIASLVWQHCDGKTDVAGIARRISAKLTQRVHSDVVQLALQQLAKARMLDEDSISGSGTTKRVTRRELIKTAGKAAAITLPLVTSIVAPGAQILVISIWPARRFDTNASVDCRSEGGMQLIRELNSCFDLSSDTARRCRLINRIAKIQV